MNAANTALNSAFLFFIVVSPLFCDINGILMNGCHSGHLRLRSERNLAYPAGAQEGRHQGFHPLVNHPFPIIARRKSERRDRSEKRNGSRVTAACLSLPFRSSQTVYCYTGRKVCAGATQGELPEGQERVPWGITVSRNSFTRCYSQHLRMTPIAFSSLWV